MIPVSGVVVGAENGAKTLAGAVMDSAEKLHFPATVLPITLHRYAAAVGEYKGRYVDRIGMSMLRQFSGSGDIAATVAAHGLDPFEVAAEILPRCPFHRIFGPCGKFPRQFAFDRPQIGDISAHVDQFDTVDLAATAAELAVGQRRETNVGFAKIAETLTRRRTGIKRP